MGLKDWVSKNIVDIGTSEQKESEGKPFQPASNPNFPNFNPINTGAPAVSQYSPVSTSNNTDENTKKFKLHFDKLFKEANLPKPDFYDFKTMIDAMQGIPDITSYPVCFGALKGQGLTLPSLLESANKYAEILNNDEKSFLEQLKNKSQNDVVSKEISANELKAQNDEKLKLIQQLTTEINENTLKIQEYTLGAVQAAQKLKDKENNYLFALQSTQIGLKKDIERINELLTPIKTNNE